MKRKRYSWWPYIKTVVRRYPDMKHEFNELIRPRITTSYSMAAGGSNQASRTTENTALRILSSGTVQELEAIEKTIRHTKELTDGEDRMKLIDLVYWRQSHNLHGAALKLNISYATAKRWNENFFLNVARRLKLL